MNYAFYFVKMTIMAPQHSVPHILSQYTEISPAFN